MLTLSTNSSKVTEMNTTAETYNILLEKIAKKWFDVETLERRGSDGLDFYDVSVGCIKNALDEAFKAGMEVGYTITLKEE